MGRIPYEHYLCNWDMIRDITQAVPPVRPDDTVMNRSKNLLALLKKYWTPCPLCRPDVDLIEKELENISLRS